MALPVQFITVILRTQVTLACRIASFSSEAARCHVTREQKEVSIWHACHSSLNMLPKKIAKQKGTPKTKKATRCASPYVSEPEPLSEMGDVSDHRQEGVAFGRVLGTL